MLNVPLVRQATGYTCGAASLVAVLAYFGKDSREDRLAKELRAEPPNGVTPERLVDVAKEYGVHAEMRQQLTEEGLLELVRQGHPVLIVVQAWSERPRSSYSDDWEDGHYIVTIGEEGGQIVFMDPSLAGRHTTMTMEELHERWHDKNKGHIYDHMGIIFSGTAAELPPVEDETAAEAEWRQEQQRNPRTPTAKSHATTGSVHTDRAIGEERTKATHTREYLEAYHATAVKQLHPSQHREIHAAAMPASGGAAGRRKPEHTALERAALADLSAEHLRDRDNETLTAVWEQLEKWHRLASRKGLDTADYERAAKLVGCEMSDRGMEMDPDGHLARRMLGKSGEDERIVIARPAADGRGRVSVRKFEGEKQLLWYAAAVPGEVDTYGDSISAEEAEDACHRFMRGPQLIYIEHGEKRGLNADGRWPDVLNELAQVVESGLLFDTTTQIFGHPLPRPLPERTWFVVIYVHDPALWVFLRDTPNGISWRGRARRENR
jgi:predicted double-glycine peptidase